MLKDEFEAMRRLLRAFRHEMATPLSGSLLHLEVAARRIRKGTFPEAPALLESLGIAREELEKSIGLLDALTEAATETLEEPADFSLPEALARAASALGPAAAERGVTLEIPALAPRPVQFGHSDRVERAISALTRHALGLASGPGRIVWSLGEPEGPVRLVCDSPAGPSAVDPERLVLREPPLLLARWAIECHGGTLKMETGGDRLRAVLDFPAAS